jgi:hypothetical protein
MANSEQPNANSTWISEGLLIASAPVAAYLLTLSYIGGYVRFFQIPTEFISLNITALFSVAGNIVFVGMFVYVLFLVFFLLWPHTDSPILWRALRVFPFAALLLIQLMFFGKRWHEWVGSLFIFAFLVMHYFTTP